MYISIQIITSPVLLNPKKVADNPYSPFPRESSLLASFFLQDSFKNHFKSRKLHFEFQNLKKRTSQTSIYIFTSFSAISQSSNFGIPRQSFQTIPKHWTFNLELFYVYKERNFKPVIRKKKKNQVKYKTSNK